MDFYGGGGCVLGFDSRMKKVLICDISIHSSFFNRHALLYCLCFHIKLNIRSSFFDSFLHILFNIFLTSLIVLIHAILY